MSLPASPSPSLPGLQARTQLGCQVWLEPDDSAARVDMLFARAAESVIGWVRLFLMWPWIEEQPGAWNFEVFDRAFDAAVRHDIRIKATLTANSGPWWLGTPSMLHSHTGFLAEDQRAPMERYIRACVTRYANHEGLGQWILWNEPNGGGDRTPETLVHWQNWLARHYLGDIGALNYRWRTGYAAFAEVQFPEDIPHPAHRGHFWNSYGPWLLDWQARAAWLNGELAWIKEIVRSIDLHTDLCVNPTEVLSNQALGGTDLEKMGGLVEVIGASYHPAWHFTFADRLEFPALMVAGVRLEAAQPSVRRVEVTEVQSGNTLNSSNRPANVTPAEVARFYLAGLAAGAESVTGWCLNARSHDFEAGDWGLLDNQDRPSGRSRMLATLRARLDGVYARTGRWAPAPPRAWVGISPAAQAIEAAEARGTTVPGRLAHDGAHGAALLAVRLQELGIAAAMAPLHALPAAATQRGDLLVLSHVVAWDETATARLLGFAESGGCLLLDATCGRKTPDASLHRPWPGGLAAQIGLSAVDLETRPDGYELALYGEPAGRWLLARLRAELDPAAGWQAWEELRYAVDGEPCVFERPYGAGRIVFVRGMLGPSQVHTRSVAAARYILARAGAAARPAIRPAGSHWATTTIPVAVEQGALTVVLAPELLDRGGRPLRLHAAPGHYVDLWSGSELACGPDGEVALAAEDGIALLWQQD
jgi:hypothetical protein